MDRKIARQKYHSQRKGARERGIGWELTFEQWLLWWGDDLDRRGSGPDDLQMQRPADVGPYALWNIRKGTPRQNAKTRGAVVRTQRTLIRASLLDKARELSEVKREPPPDDVGEDEKWLRDKMSARRPDWTPKY